MGTMFTMYWEKNMNKLMIRLIQFYQKNLHSKTSAHCKYRPTCSNYSIEAYQKFSFFKATFLTFFRILRCNPLSHGGYDPVPKTLFEKELEKVAKLLERPS